MTMIHTADDGWQYAEVEFKSTISESRYNVCGACHDTDYVIRIVLPSTNYRGNGRLSTKYIEYWICRRCYRKLMDVLNEPEAAWKERGGKE